MCGVCAYVCGVWRAVSECGVWGARAGPVRWRDRRNVSWMKVASNRLSPMYGGPQRMYGGQESSTVLFPGLESGQGPRTGLLDGSAEFTMVGRVHGFEIHNSMKLSPSFGRSHWYTERSHVVIPATLYRSCAALLDSGRVESTAGGVTSGQYALSCVPDVCSCRVFRFRAGLVLWLAVAPNATWIVA